MPTQDLYGVVVLGAMNPRIHHPSWYQLVGVLSEEESEEALSSPNTFGISGVAQLQVPSLPLTIICQDQRWEAQTGKKEQFDRLLQITWKVFDELLKHTPIKTFGANFHLHRQTRCGDVSRFLADRAAAMSIGLAGGENSSASVTLSKSFDDHKSTVTVQGSLESKQSVSVYCNDDFPIVSDKPGFFNLEERFGQRCGQALCEAERRAKLVVRAINAEDERNAGCH